ncbi:MAG: hypothetical protein K6G89_08650 [Clostridia bacterium]|nr:hypothetical protein [Clostridia bacterium]
MITENLEEVNAFSPPEGKRMKYWINSDGLEEVNASKLKKKLAFTISNDNFGTFSIILLGNNR